jgi:predicted N-acetyltransferase YhbS
MKEIGLMEIRPEQAGDAHAIYRLTNAAFENVPYSRKTEAAIAGLTHEWALMLIPTLDRLNQLK